MKFLLTAFLGALSLAPIQAEELRSFDLSIVRTFHQPVKLSIGWDGNSASLRTQIWAGSGGYDWKEIESDRKRALTAAEVEKLRKWLAAISIAELKNLKNTAGLDGSSWKLSFGVAEEKRVAFWSPGSSSKDRGLKAFHALGEYLWELAGIEGKLY